MTHLTDLTTTQPTQNHTIRYVDAEHATERNYKTQILTCIAITAGKGTERTIRYQNSEDKCGSTFYDVDGGSVVSVPSKSLLPFVAECVTAGKEASCLFYDHARGCDDA